MGINIQAKHHHSHKTPKSGTHKTTTHKSGSPKRGQRQEGGKEKVQALPGPVRPRVLLAGGEHPCLREVREQVQNLLHIAASQLPAYRVLPWPFSQTECLFL